MSDDFKKKNLKKRLAALHEDYEAANNQLSRALNDVERLRLQRLISDLEREIQQVERDLGRGKTSGISATSETFSPEPDGLREEISVLGLKKLLNDWKWIVGILIAIIGCIGTWLAVPGIFTFLQGTVTPTPAAISTSQQCDDFNGQQIDENKWQFEEKPNVTYVQNGVLNFDVTAEQSESKDIRGSELVWLPVGRPIKEISFTTTLVSYKGDIPGGAGLDIYLKGGQAFSAKVGPGPKGRPGLEFSICQNAPCSQNYDDYEHPSGGSVQVSVPIPMRVVWTGRAIQFYVKEVLYQQRSSVQTPITKFQLSMYADPGSEFHMTMDDVCVIYEDN